MDALVWPYGKLAHGMGTFVVGTKTPPERSHRHENGTMGPSSESTCGRRLTENCGGMIWSIQVHSRVRPADGKKWKHEHDYEGDEQPDMKIYKTGTHVEEKVVVVV